MREASDDVRETLHALDVELAREHNETLVTRVAVLTRHVHAALVKALRIVHTSQRNNK